ncbi:tetratricopeptide repeat protein [Siculibacillus lacustris]|uniref:Tetratricopeptide repeat protein n=1 Tax=Siculibacillus lacustris TaxID=1549641 RepID=A0A4Q9VT55_9HYPH|nr:tetratricopeptide repeat protein [Siculibacillus lacustris]TBW39219.1 tetratricopeptide repeat protein [Siculibacillus lacustris]
MPQRPRSSRLLLALALVAATGLAGCATPRRTDDPATTGSIGTAPQDDRATMEAWTARYRERPDDPSVAMNFAAALRADGRFAQAVEVLQKTMLQAPGDTGVAAAYGKALAENGDFAEALKVIRAANPPRTPDWRLTSAEGAIQDQLGNTAEARRLYGEALKMVPDEPSVLNNLGLSFVFTNELAKAEATLRRAAQNPRADSRVRQNLALVIGLAGRFDEARRVATAELPPDEAEANIAYLKAMLSQPDTWKQIRAADRKPAAG